MSSLRERISELEYDIFMAEDSGYTDWKFLSQEDKERIRKTALYLVLEGWSK